MMPKSVKRFSDDIMLYLLDLEPELDGTVAERGKPCRQG
jgi:hypothetical protein